MRFSTLALLSVLVFIKKLWLFRSSLLTCLYHYNHTKYWNFGKEPGFRQHEISKSLSLKNQFKFGKEKPGNQNVVFLHIQQERIQSNANHPLSESMGNIKFEGR